MEILFPIKLKTENFLNISKCFFFLFILALFFPVRYVFPTISSFQTGAYSDFTSISLYLSDIFLIISSVFLISSKRSEFLSSIKKFGLLFFWLILVLFWHLKEFTQLNLYQYAKFLELIVTYGTVLVLCKNFSLKKPFFTIFATLGTVQAIIALIQFIKQSPVGLYKLGEQVIMPQIIGIAKIILDFTAYIRGYGTFPHPNPLSAFLVVTILTFLYLILISSKKWQQILSIFALFISILGLTTTLSRAAFSSLVVVIMLNFIFLVFHEKQAKRLILSAVIILFSLLTSFLVFKPYLLTRATISDSASLERIVYARIGWQIVKDNAIFGIGLGESVLHMQQYSNIRLWPWQIQPVHNYFLLAATELGVVGALILAYIFVSHLKRLLQKLKNLKDNFNELVSVLLLACIFIAFLILMQFDHYFYTLQQTQMLLWVILGIIGAETIKPAQNELPSLERREQGRVT